jgi:membrane protein implicated in regulation of membrane protease activity
MSYLVVRGESVGYKIFQALLVLLLVVFTTAGIIMLITGMISTFVTTNFVYAYAGGVSVRFLTFLMLLLIVAALFWRRLRRRQ